MNIDTRSEFLSPISERIYEKMISIQHGENSMSLSDDEREELKHDDLCQIEGLYDAAIVMHKQGSFELEECRNLRDEAHRKYREYS